MHGHLLPTSLLDEIYPLNPPLTSNYHYLPDRLMVWSSRMAGMSVRNWPLVTIIVIASLPCLVAAVPDAHDDLIYDVPRLNDVAIDARSDDWGEGGLLVNVLGNGNPDRPIRSSLDAKFRLAWDQRGLLVLVDVHDPQPAEARLESELYKGSSVELFMSPSAGSPDITQFIISPGIDSSHDRSRIHPHDHRISKSLKSHDITCIAQRSKSAHGYLLEVLLPWENLDIKPQPNRELAFQLYVNGPPNTGGPLVWYPSAQSWNDSQKMHRIRLSEKPSPPINLAVTAGYHHFRHAVVEVRSTTTLATSTLQLRDGDKLLTTSPPTSTDDNHVARLSFPIPPLGHPYRQLALFSNNKLLGQVSLPSLDEQRMQTFEQLPFVFNPAVFSQKAFPQGQFADPSLVEDLIGPHTLKTTYYNAAHELVTTADAPGRYGAIMEITTEAGQTFKRFATLFRQPEIANWDEMRLSVSAQFPKGAGIDPAVLQQQSFTLASHLKDRFTDFGSNPQAAVVLAALYETKPGGHARAAVRDAIWWHDLKKKTGDLQPYKYLTYLPADYDADAARRWPLILFLHGSGQCGANLDAVKAAGLPARLEHDHSLPFIVIAPQNPADVDWNPADLSDALDQTIQRLRVDATRIYLTGLSLGGYGTWMMASQYSARFAAAVPICGAWDPTDAPLLQDIPIWAFHGAKDDVVPLRDDQDMVEAVKKVGGNIRFTIDPAAAHDSWTAAYARDDLYTWLLQHQRK